MNDIIDDRNTGSVSDLTLRALVTFSNNFISLKHDVCYAALRSENFSLINQRAQILYPKLCDLLNNKLIKRLKILIDASVLYYNLDCEGLSSNYKNLEQLPTEVTEADLVSGGNIGGIGGSSNGCQSSTEVIPIQTLNPLSIHPNEIIEPSKSDKGIIKSSDKDKPTERETDMFKLSFIEEKKKLIDQEIGEMITLIQQHVTSLKTIVESMNLIGETIKQLQLLNQRINQEIIPTDQVFNEENFTEIIESLEFKKETINQKANEYEKDFFYIRNTFSPILSQLNEDSNTLQSLLKCYHSILILDHLTAMENTVTVTKNLERIKAKQSLMYEIKLYIFFIQFSLDNEYKMDLLFSTYFENKKNMLLLNYKSINDEPSTTKNEAIIIKDQILQLRPKDGHEKILQKCLEDNIELYYFAFVFEKKKFLMSNSMTQIEEGYMKYCYDNLMFIDSDEDYGLVTILHVNEAYYKTLLKDFRNSITKISNSSREDSKSSSMIVTNSFMTKYRCNKNIALLQYKISNYIFIIVKIKEKNSNEIGYLTEICKDFRNKFTDYHILKTIVPYKKKQIN